MLKEIAIDESADVALRGEWVRAMSGSPLELVEIVLAEVNGTATGAWKLALLELKTFAPMRSARLASCARTRAGGASRGVLRRCSVRSDIPMAMRPRSRSCGRRPGRWPRSYARAGTRTDARRRGAVGFRGGARRRSLPSGRTRARRSGSRRSAIRAPTMCCSRRSIAGACGRALRGRSRASADSERAADLVAARHGLAAAEPGRVDVFHLAAQGPVVRELELAMQSALAEAPLPFTAAQRTELRERLSN